jgi:FkbM family methyltransferase
LNVVEWDIAIIVNGNVLFRHDCPDIIEVTGQRLSLLDVGQLIDNKTRFDYSVVICPRGCYDGVLKQQVNGVYLLDPKFNWTAELPWSHRHRAYVVSYGNDSISYCDLLYFTTSSAIYPIPAVSDFRCTRSIIRDLAGSMACDDEIINRDVYNMRTMSFQPNDVIIDIGANVGIFCIAVAQMQSKLRILSFEPLIENYNNLVHNLVKNSINNVMPHNLAVTSDSRRIYVRSETDMTSIATIYSRYERTKITDFKYVNVVNSITVDLILDQFNISVVKLLKIDAEGAEYEIIYSIKSFDRIENLVVETHGDLGTPRWSPDALEKFLKDMMPGRYKLIHCK